ncbi:Uncharacterized protein HSBGL_0323 [Halapricum desulfuricans]|uniref:Uncharacterized protein n=1 Tax=Halapricum desulfuricans TaxID=2841257 RepID=A0A897N8N2_9EURY|nr:Uncharacterized protein HSBGL_0323 [Halapricum desulfuricans]
MGRPTISGSEPDETETPPEARAGRDAHGDTTSMLDRRSVLTGVAGAGVASVAGCSLLETGKDGPATEVGPERARSFAEEFAPTIYFDRNEQWFPTDPRSYESERDGETIVSGFDAFEGYVQDGTDDKPPDPAVFYRAIEYEESPLAVVQYWMYSAFDQFTTNFHWHDWELLQVFLDTETREPQLYVASSHSRSVPNNEFLDPERRPRILTELGSHSSGLSVNENEDEFQQFQGGASGLKERRASDVCRKHKRVGRRGQRGAKLHGPCERVCDP